MGKQGDTQENTHCSHLTQCNIMLVSDLSDTDGITEEWLVGKRYCADYNMELKE